VLIAIIFTLQIDLRIILICSHAMDYLPDRRWAHLQVVGFVENRTAAIALLVSTTRSLYDSVYESNQ